ncbi:MAG: trigger factor [Oxalobacter sp.]|nr:MAG: trigger factor [Oxalobacter sp.]
MATVETLDKLERRITINIPRDEVKTEVDKRLKARARTAKAPGFRPGKVPMKMIEAQFGHDITTSVLEQKIHEVFSTSASANNLRVAGYPRIEIKTGSELLETHYAFNATFEVYPEFSMGDLSALAIEKVKVDIDESEVDNTINVLRKGRAEFHARGVQGKYGDGGSDISAHNGDMVTINFNGTIDGVEFEGGKSEGYAFVLGDGQMLPAFETAVLGMRVGEEKKFPLTFPADYHGKDVAGKTAEFTVSVSQIEWPHLPEVDAEFVKSLGLASGEVSDMRAEIRDSLVRESETRLKAINKQNVLDALNKAATFDVPKALVDQEVNQLIEMAKTSIAQMGRDPLNSKLPVELFTEQAERRVRLGLILGDLVEANQLKATPEQIRAQVEALAKSYQDPQMVINYYYGDKNRMAEVESMVLEDNVVNHVLDKASVTDKTMPFEELMARRVNA